MNTAFLLQEEQGHGEISADAGTFGRQGVANLASLTPGDAERCCPLATSGIQGSRDPGIPIPSAAFARLRKAMDVVLI